MMSLLHDECSIQNECHQIRCGVQYGNRNAIQFSQENGTKKLLIIVLHGLSNSQYY